MSRAVSDTVGYVLVFGLIVSTVAVVYVGGFGALADARDTQRFDNAERAFDVLDSNIEDSMVRGAPSRATELRLSDASLEFGEPVSFNVTTDSGDWYERTMRPIVYRANSDSQLVYANGAVFRQYGDVAYLFEKPRIATGDETIIPFATTDDDSDGVSTHDTRRLLVRTTVTDRNVAHFEDASANVTVTSPRASAWQRYFEEGVGLECTFHEDDSNDEVECELPDGDVYVQDVEVDVEYT